MEYVAYDGDADESCWPVASTEISASNVYHERQVLKYKISY